MQRVPLLWEDAPLGELRAEREGLYTRLEARCTVPGEGLWCAWAVGETGETLYLGILEPDGNRFSIRRRLPSRTLEPLGMLLRGELRPRGETGLGWKKMTGPEAAAESPWLRSRLRDLKGVLLRRSGKELLLAAPYDKGKPFPLEELFCFASPARIGGREYLLFRFDGEERPCFGEPPTEEQESSGKKNKNQK